MTSMTCPTCNGLGKLDCSAPDEAEWSCEMTCWHCDGEGSFPDDEVPDPAQAWADWNAEQMARVWGGDGEGDS